MIDRVRRWAAAAARGWREGAVDPSREADALVAALELTDLLDHGSPAQVYASAVDGRLADRCRGAGGALVALLARLDDTVRAIDRTREAILRRRAAIIDPLEAAAADGDLDRYVDLTDARNHYAAVAAHLRRPAG